MKEITILSGKGGTGKTSITAAIASVAEQAVFCDNDVDAADLHLLLQPDVLENHVFLSGCYGIIDQEKCTGCNICMDKCRFDAIHIQENGQLEINPFQCEGCKLCERLCPVDAISMKESSNNEWFISSTRFGTLVHARMGPGEENSGRLVTKVRQQASQKAKEEEKHYVINDGPPGIGCAVIASMTNVNLVLVVIEATKSGWHDAERLIELAHSFGIEVFAVINKFDINLEVTADIVKALEKVNVPLITKIPFDKIMVDSMSAGQTIVEYAPDSDIAKQIKDIWKRIN